MSEADGILLEDVLPEAECLGPAGRPINGCVARSDEVTPGDAYVELERGLALDERQTRYDEARQRGAVALVCEPDAAHGVEGLVVHVVGDAQAAYARICQALAGQPSRSLRVVGVLGSSGKTTSACLAAAVLESGGARCALWSSLGVFDGDALLRPESHDAPALATWLARSKASGCSHAVLEISREALTRRALAGIEFDVMAVTELRHDPHDSRLSADEQRRGWESALEQLSLGGFAVLNADDPGCCRVLAEMSGPVLTYGLEHPAEVAAQIVERRVSEQTFLLTHGQDTAPVRTTMAGDHNVAHALLAAAVGAAYGLELADAVRGIESVRRIPGRLERLECGQGFGVFVDEAQTPERLGASLAALRRVARGRVICVCGVAASGPETQREAVGQVLENSADVAVLCGASDRHEIDATLADGVLRGFRRRLSPRVIRDRAAAIRWALSEAREGDVVLLAGRCRDGYGLVDEGHWPAGDRETARRWLYEHAASRTGPVRRAA